MRIPTVLWAQRPDRLYVTIDLQDVSDQTIKLDNDDEQKVGKLHFDGKAGPEKIEYELDITFYSEIDVKESKVSVSGRNIFLVVQRKEPGEYWPRLTKDSGRHLSHIKCDWDKWVDEDELGDGSGKDVDMSQYGNFSNFDMGGMGGDMAGMMGGMGGMGGMMGGMGGMGDMGDLGGEEDSDDEELEDLKA